MIKNVTVVGDEPVTASDAKNYLRIDFDEDDVLIGSLITAAREHIENICNINLVKKEITFFHGGYTSLIYLPETPFHSIVQVTSNGVEVTDYNIESNVDGDAYIEFETNHHEIEVKFLSGYEEIPRALWQAMLFLISHWYENRNIISENSTSKIDFTINAIIAPFRRWPVNK